MWLGWRAIFAFLGLGMIAASAAAWRFWPETRVQRVAGLQWSQLLLPVKCLNFWLYTLCYAAGMGSFFVFFSIAPGLMMGRQGVSQLGFSLLFATVAIAMVFTARFMGRVIPKWGSPSVLRMGMGCLIAGAVLLAITEIWASQSVLGFIAPMWLVGIGVATAVSVSPNGALRGFDHVAGTVTAVYFCLGGVLLGSIGTLIISLLPRNTAAGCRVLFDPCNSRARSVLCFPSEGLSRRGSMMWSRYKVRKVHQIPIVERMWQAIAQQIAAADPKPLRGFGRLSSGVRCTKHIIAHSQTIRSSLLLLFLSVHNKPYTNWEIYHERLAFSCYRNSWRSNRNIRIKI